MNSEQVCVQYKTGVEKAAFCIAFYVVFFRYDMNVVFDRPGQTTLQYSGQHDSYTAEPLLLFYF